MLYSKFPDKFPFTFLEAAAKLIKLKPGYASGFDLELIKTITVALCHNPKSLPLLIDVLKLAHRCSQLDGIAFPTILLRQAKPHIACIPYQLQPWRQLSTIPDLPGKLQHWSGYLCVLYLPPTH